jgi:LmbE family N-acetylglucosaminyl deacetylase
MGGTIHRMAEQGTQVVHLVLMVQGYQNSGLVYLETQERVQDATSAATVLGISHLEIDRTIPENKGLSHVDYMVGLLDRLIQEMQPTEVYTCLPWFNDDHVAVYRATLAAMRRSFSPMFWAYEMPQQDLGYHIPEHGWRYVSLDDQDVAMKLKGLAQYERTQSLVSKTGPVSTRGAEALAMMRGTEIGTKWAERQLLLRG